MAVEYLYDAIRATAGQDICICAEITDDDGNLITDACSLMLYNDEEILTKVNGSFDGEQWSFNILADATKGLKGRYWYSISRSNTSLCFKTPIYLM